MSRLIVDASKKSWGLNLKELFLYKDLFWTLAWRDLRVRYAQTFLGLFWAFIQPAATLVIFILIFGRAINIDTAGIPYSLFALTGLSAWTYFGFVLKESGNSIIGAQEMVKKIYFPRLIIPLSKAAVGFVDFGVAILFLISLFIFHSFVPSLNIVFLPLFILLIILAAIAIGIWLSALTIRYRDFQHVVPFIVQFGLWATPVAYPADLIVKNLSPSLQVVYYLNPMAGLVEGFRWSLLGYGRINELFYVSMLITGLLFISGLYYFRRVERVMADFV